MAESKMVEFPFFDRMRYLKYTFTDYADLEIRSGKTPIDFVGNLMRLSAVDMRLALYIGLRHEDKRVVTLDWVSQQLQKYLEGGGALTRILTAIDEAFSVSGYFTTREEGSDTANPPIASSASTLKVAASE